MTRRCRHEWIGKDDYPDDMICEKCQRIWRITEYLGWTAKELMTLPKDVRYAVLKRQVEQFQKDNLDYYGEGEGVKE